VWLPLRASVAAFSKSSKPGGCLAGLVMISPGDTSGIDRPPPGRRTWSRAFPESKAALPALLPI